MAADPSVSPEVMGIRDLYRRASVAVSRGLRGQVWIRAELSAIREHNLHCFIKLAEPARDGSEGDAVLDVVIWRSTWHRTRQQLEDRSLVLREGMTVTLRGELRIRSENGRMQLECTALDTDALLGELAARRLALRRTLAAEGLLDRNRGHALPPLPLRIGLVASHQSEGYRDFRGVLSASGFGFVLTERPVLVQGVSAPPSIAAAVESLAKAPIDLIVLVRGGGARADLDAFDHELVVRAIAAAALPVWTGLGHTGDRCLADDLAHASHATPTACAQALVSLVSDFAAGIVARSQRLQELARIAGAAAGADLEARRRSLTHNTRAQLDRCAYGLAGRARGLELSGRRNVAHIEAAVAVKARELPEA
ncbi:MAG: exodeoxyribonuclease VII large subunit, partial [Actinobacteria bacterium]|nr:exodeoxyribonuclease VII large subunit [Actinomycetota bacterium]